MTLEVDMSVAMLTNDEGKAADGTGVHGNHASYIRTFVTNNFKYSKILGNLYIVFQCILYYTILTFRKGGPLNEHSPASRVMTSTTIGQGNR